MVTKIKSLLTKMGLNCLFSDKKLQKVFRISLLAVVISTILTSFSFAAAPRTPSQALPKMFQKPSSVDYYEMKRQEAIIPKIMASAISKGIEIIIATNLGTTT